MKFFAVALFVGCIAFATSTSKEIDEKLNKYKTECIAETGIDEEVVKKCEEGVFGDDAKSKAFFVCYLKKPGFINDAGEYQDDAMKAAVSEKYDEATADKFIEECTKENHGNAEDNALHMVKCYHEHVTKKH